MSLAEEFLQFRNDLIKELPMPNMLLCCTADRLLILVERQGVELAALHEQIMRYQADPQYDARYIEGQEKTEAALREPMECGHPRFFWVDEQHVCGDEHECQQGVGCYPAHCRLCEQHSADLREVAEMAIAKCEAKYLPAIQYMYNNSGFCGEMGCGCTASQIIAPVLWADMRKELFNVNDILREFREKKAKAASEPKECR